MDDNKELINTFGDKIVLREYDEYNLGEDAELDKYALDIEAENQAHLYQKWSELLAQAQAQVSKLKEVLANLEAELTLKIRQDGIEGIPKPTEAVYKAWVITQPRYKQKLAKKRKVENSIIYLQNALKVLEHKKAMIKVESDLWITGYYARPHVTEETKKEMDESRKTQHSVQLKKSLTKRHLRQQQEND